MYTAVELQMLRNAAGDVAIPGIDTPTGNQLPTKSLISVKDLGSGNGYSYDPNTNRLVVTKDGLTLSGIDFGNTTLTIMANNVTVKNSTFEPTSVYYSVIDKGTNNTIAYNTFTGPTYSTPLADFINGGINTTIKSNSFIDAPSDAIAMTFSGTITGNYFSGAGYQAAAHPDAIWVPKTTGPVTITGNFIDWTWNSGVETNDTVRITTELGNTSNVTVTGNYLLGGSYTVQAGGGAAGTTMSNVTISGNYLGFGQFGAIMPGSPAGVTISGNTTFDWRNSTLSTAAWAAYLKAGLPTASLVVAASNGNALANSSASSTLYGGSHLFGTVGSNKVTNYVGGYGGQYIFFGATAVNVLTELAVSDSTLETGTDYVSYFDPGKDVIDLSNIDADPTKPGLQSFTYIGTASFSGSGAQVRYSTGGGTTIVQAKLAGDASADIQITLGGNYTLSAANFALTPADSAAVYSGVSKLSSSAKGSGNAIQHSFSNVTGKSYNSYQSVAVSQVVLADNYNMSASANQISVNGSNVTITRGSGAESIAAGTGSFAQTYHAHETIQIGAGASSTTIKLGTNFGAETVTGFSATGSGADAIELPIAAFSYLKPGMTQAQDLAAVLSHASMSAAGLIIRDSNSDSLTLAGVRVDLLATSSSIRFV